MKLEMDTIESKLVPQKATRFPSHRAAREVAELCGDTVHRITEANASKWVVVGTDQVWA